MQTPLNPAPIDEYTTKPHRLWPASRDPLRVYSSRDSGVQLGSRPELFCATMIVMPSCSSGWIWHCLARETGNIGHLYSPGAQRGPWPWMPYAMDCGTFAMWNPSDNSFNDGKWITAGVAAWRRMLFWSASSSQKPLWAIVPDRPGCWLTTVEKWREYAEELKATGIPLAVAVQDNATASTVHRLNPKPDVITIGGSTDWKWNTVEMWAKEFPRVHLLRCNQPDRLEYLHKLGIESCDGTGWNRGSRRQTRGLEEFCFQHRSRLTKRFPIWPHVSRAAEKEQTTFA